MRIKTYVDYNTSNILAFWKQSTNILVKSRDIFFQLGIQTKICLCLREFLTCSTWNLGPMVIKYWYFHNWFHYMCLENRCTFLFSRSIKCRHKGHLKIECLLYDRLHNFEIWPFKTHLTYSQYVLLNEVLIWEKIIER